MEEVRGGGGGGEGEKNGEGGRRLQAIELGWPKRERRGGLCLKGRPCLLACNLQIKRLLLLLLLEEDVCVEEGEETQENQRMTIVCARRHKHS